jgi:SAM-dependent methyltransferase
MAMQEEWESAYSELDKTVASAEAIGGYDLIPLLKVHATPASRILDFGSGTGQGLLKLRQAGYVNALGADPSEFLLGRAPLEVRPFLSVIRQGRLPFNDASFDVVYASGVLHHIEWRGLEGCFREIARVLKPGGVFLYAEPRKSLARSVGHLVLLSPLAGISKQASTLAAALRGEGPTYFPWLQRHPAEFLPLTARCGFETLSVENRLVTQLGALRSGGKT